MQCDVFETKRGVNGSESISFELEAADPTKSHRNIHFLSEQFRLCGYRWRFEVTNSQGGGLGVFLYNCHVPLNSDAVKLTKLPPNVFKSFGQKFGEPKYEHVIVKDILLEIKDRTASAEQQIWTWGGTDEAFIETSNVKALAFTSAEYGGWGCPEVLPKKDWRQQCIENLRFTIAITPLP